MIFQIGDYVVCPGHGVGQIANIETRELGGTQKEFYSVKIVSNGMKVMVPLASQDTENPGVRPLVCENEVGEVFHLLNDKDINPDRSTWNRRYRDYMAKVNTGSLIEIASVLRALLVLRVSKRLSYGEKKMVEKCRSLLAQEISFCTGQSEKDIVGEIDAIYS